MILERGYWSASSARSRDSRASGNVSRKSEIIPTRCVPCPGKNIAVVGRVDAFD
jgi:hypothetical protein